MFESILPCSVISYFNLDNNVLNNEKLATLAKYQYQEFFRIKNKPNKTWDEVGQEQSLFKRCVDNLKKAIQQGCDDPDTLYLYAIMISSSYSGLLEPMCLFTPPLSTT